MFQLIKRIFSKKHQADSMFPSNRFEHVDWEQELADATRRLVNDEGHYDEQGNTVELELSEERIISCCILPQGMKLNVWKSCSV